MGRDARRTLVPAVIALTLALAPAAAAQTTVEGTIKGGTIRPDAASCAGAICGDGTLAPFGAAGYVYAPETFEQLDRSCFAVTAVLNVALLDGRGTLDLATESAACFRGNAANTKGSERSWGNAVTDSGTWSVTGGTGIFDGATGEGTFIARAAGAALSARLSGVLELSGG